MVNSQEVIERSFYMALLTTSEIMGLSLNKDNYLGTKALMDKYKKDIDTIISQKGFFVNIFGTGNNQSKGDKIVPRIVIKSDGFIPGDVGVQATMLEEDIPNNGYVVSSYPSELIDQYIEIHLVANLQTQMRWLHKIMFEALPKRGYLKPYTEGEPLYSGNIFIETVNFADITETYEGVMEKVYYYKVKDTMIEQVRTLDTVSPIREIEVTINKNENEPRDVVFYIPEKPMLPLMLEGKYIYKDIMNYNTSWKLKI